MEVIKFLLRWIVLIIATAIVTMTLPIVGIIAIAYVIMVPCIICLEHLIAWLSTRSPANDIGYDLADYGSTLLVPFKGMWRCMVWASTGNWYG